ncbi:MAG: hypothetical protein ACRDKW_16495, partial [Actinomycetota bacterium]
DLDRAGRRPRRGQPPRPGAAPVMRAGVARRRPVLWGLVVVALYLAVAVWSVASGLLAGRPLYDGIPLVPYKWVNPPPNRVADNEKPEPFEKLLKMTPTGQPDPGSATSPDAQAVVLFSRTLDPSEYQAGGDNNFRVKITPLDAPTVGPRPAGRFFDSNAYRMEAWYPSGTPVTTGTFDIIQSYAVHGTDIRRWDGTAWVPLDKPSAQREQYQIYSPSDTLGTFVVTGDGDVPREPEQARRSDIVFIVLGLGAVVGVGIAIATNRRKGPEGVAARGSRPAKR